MPNQQLNILCLSRSTRLSWLVASGIFLSACASYTGEGRTPGEFIDDAYIERVVLGLIEDAHEDMGAARIKVVCMDGKVLLAGEVSSEQLKTLAEEQVLKVRHVRSVHNELAVSAKPAFLARTNDALLTSKVKTRMLADEVRGTRIKVVTVNNIVYLMGAVSEQEGEMAGTIAAETSGVLRVVKLFDYVEPVE